MKNKNYLFIFSLIIAGSLTFLACSDDFLNTPPQGALDGAVLSTSKAGVDATVISAYKSLIGWTGNWNEQAWGTAPSNWVFNVASDEHYKGSEPGDGDETLQFQLYQWGPGNPNLRSKFAATYEGIARANAAIRTATTFGETNAADKVFADQKVGEGLFLRAFFHFEAYKVWKNIPYYLENDTDFKKPNDQPVLPLIIADLDKAISLLPDTRAQIGRTDKIVATAYLGKAKLYAKDYTGALAAFNTVIGSGRFSLVDCFYDNFSVAGDNNAESILAVQTSVNDGAADGDNSNFGERLAQPHGDSNWGCCGFKNPSHDLAFSYKVDDNGLPVVVTGSTVLARIPVGSSTPLDPRIDWTMGRTGINYLNWGPHSDTWIRGQGYAGWYSPKKNINAKGDANLDGSWSGAQLTALNVELMRYSDLLLMAAECEVEVGSLEKAREYVNAIRKRAGNCAQAPVGSSTISTSISDPAITQAVYKVGEYTTAWSNKDAARDAVRLERKLELALEGHRIFDLQRWGNMKEVLNAYIAREKGVVSVMSNASPVEDKHVAFPIPDSEIARSGGNLKQNSGY
ncbi:MAG: RagB/SusD family nutrient uptake outer membrane protein [Saprospiraceae bacterium]|nr:RagB/SusD family nutrient uptake outer membrane protein [Saprospiraceae bacterium]MBP6567547.1 RagB/SusD family nutrient uptake outer membrane protein [Saprospiraceae bacterium]